MKTIDLGIAEFRFWGHLNEVRSRKFHKQFTPRRDAGELLLAWRGHTFYLLYDLYI